MLRALLSKLPFALALGFLGASLPLSAAELGGSPAGHFVFHSDVAVNLHHFLYHWARAEEREMKLFGRVRVDPADRQVELDDAETEVWDGAVTVYRELVERDLVFDDGMVRRKALVVAGPESWTDDEPVLGALRRALPIYRKHWWARHDRSNRAAYERLRPQLELYEAPLASALAEAYESSWPEEPIRVDLVAYANWAGAYTTDEPNHVTYSSTDPDLQGEHALEILFHESGHTDPLGSKVRPTSVAVAQELDVEEGRLWHSVLFHVTGEAVRRVLDDPGYETYAEANGLWTRSAMAAHHAPLTELWDETRSLEARLRKVHEALAEHEAAPGAEEVSLCPPGLIREGRGGPPAAGATGPEWRRRGSSGGLITESSHNSIFG